MCGNCCRAEYAKGRKYCGCRQTGHRRRLRKRKDVLGPEAPAA